MCMETRGRLGSSCLIPLRQGLFLKVELMGFCCSFSTKLAAGKPQQPSPVGTPPLHSPELEIRVPIRPCLACHVGAEI